MIPLVPRYYQVLYYYTSKLFTSSFACKSVFTSVLSVTKKSRLVRSGFTRDQSHPS